MELHMAFAKALRHQRREKKLSQEAFSSVSSRTYLSELERGLKNPTLEKIQELATTMGIHPLTLLTECYSLKDNLDIEEIFERITQELASMQNR
ncbi:MULTISPECIES: helix-turn-helix domain-containing protein [Vreelandella]|uniref:XRE family transcriptional regulator n=2 Tax=Vreelandella TaxID=3137766 RepID=A0A3S0W948_9GAMM|nr:MULTISPECIES: helix-turn-helix transcriptional regulator [Halomonas]RUR31814.1 XRE family transcriptional regulator [Halomonas nanhaiensis]RUR43615.1 XRE family transcriptional regulator [Halomonas populi]